MTIHDTLKKISICIVSKSIHYVLLDKTMKLVGGAEVQQKILAEALAEKGWKILFVTERFDDRKKIRLNAQMTLLPELDFTHGNKYLQKLVYLPLHLWKTLKDLDTDIYYQRNPNYLSGIIAFFCRVKGKRFILAGANNWNFDKSNERNLNNVIDKISARWAIRLANVVIVQNQRQMELLKRHYKREGILFYNTFNTQILRKKGAHILWVSRIETYKRPELFLALARLLPEHRFVMIGGKGKDAKLEAKIAKEASLLPNINYLGHQAFERVEALFDEASVFINTSIPDCEGFPNTFLQAWSRGIPVISFLDPDRLISTNNLGLKVASLPEMKNAVQLLAGMHQRAQDDSKRIQNFFKRNFSASDQITRFIQILVPNGIA